MYTVESGDIEDVSVVEQISVVENMCKCPAEKLLCGMIPYFLFPTV